MESILMITLLCATGIACFLWGCACSQRNEHYRLHAAQLTANDIPIYYVDQLPGIGGTKEKPDTCLAYYDPAIQSVNLSYLHPNKN